jgi:UDP-3-O-[3-hydroxymyristoyl] glucosamine N-acyltransferase
MTLREVATMVSGWVAPENESVEIQGVASLAESGPGDITFYGDPRYLRALRKAQATAVLVPHGSSEQVKPVQIWVDNPSAAFGRIVEHFAPAALSFPAGIHPSAVVDAGASIDRTACVLAGAVIERGVRIGRGSVIGAHVFLGHDAVVGDDCLLHPHATIRERCRIGNRVTIHSGGVIGADGFGYEFKDGRHLKIPQTGIVQIDDDVEIGANTTIDRARFGRTWIKTGAKIDNLVQIAHNVCIGEHAIICAQAGISGSSRIGNHATIAGQVGIVGHIEIGERAIVAAQSGVSKNVPAESIVCGSPPYPLREWKEQVARVSRLGKLIERVKRLEDRIGGK